MVGRATIKCAAALPGRTVRVEVWQKDDDGVWQQLAESVTDWEGVDLDQPFHRIDGAGFWCKKTEGDRTRPYRTRVVVGDGTGQEVETISNTEQLRRHCLAESAIEDPNLPPDSGIASAAQGTPMGVTCKPILFTPVVNGNSIDAKTRFECASIPYNDYRILLVRLAEVTPIGAYKTKKNVSFYDDGRYGAWSPTLIASCRKGSNQTTKYVTWARETYRPEFGRGDTARNTSSQVNLQARCA